jgi:hypothetical protein
MTAKKSKARAAAEKIAGVREVEDGPPPALWTRSMVERAILAFHEIERIPPYDEDGARELVRDFLRFVSRVEQGGVAEDAMALAQAFIDQGYAWLAEHPRYAPVLTRPWTLHMVEQLILWFNDATSGAHDKKRVLDVAERLRTFEIIVQNGAVEPGEAERLAEAFLDYGHRWLEGRPEALSHFQSLS